MLGWGETVPVKASHLLLCTEVKLAMRAILAARIE